MRNFIRHIKAAWLFGRLFPYIEEADAPDFWTQADCVALQIFLQSFTGTKLRHRLTNYAVKAACNAVKNPVNSQYNNGVAAGIPMALAAIDAHLPTQIETEQTEGEATFERQLA